MSDDNRLLNPLRIEAEATIEILMTPQPPGTERSHLQVLRSAIQRCMARACEHARGSDLDSLRFSYSYFWRIDRLCNVVRDLLVDGQLYGHFSPDFFERTNVWLDDQERTVMNVGGLYVKPKLLTLLRARERDTAAARSYNDEYNGAGVSGVGSSGVGGRGVRGESALVSPIASPSSSSARPLLPAARSTVSAGTARLSSASSSAVGSSDQHSGGRSEQQQGYLPELQQRGAQQGYPEPQRDPAQQGYPDQRYSAQKGHPEPQRDPAQQGYPDQRYSTQKGHPEPSRNVVQQGYPDQRYSTQQGSSVPQRNPMYPDHQYPAQLQRSPLYGSLGLESTAAAGYDEWPDTAAAVAASLASDAAAAAAAAAATDVAPAPSAPSASVYALSSYPPLAGRGGRAPAAPPASASARSGGAAPTRPALRPLVIPSGLVRDFIALSAAATATPPSGIETCAYLLGRDTGAEYVVTVLFAPEQRGNSDHCEVTEAGDTAVAVFCISEQLMELGWVHTHPSQGCFMSAVDLHTHLHHQDTLAEAVALVVAPNDPSAGPGGRYAAFRLTDATTPPHVLTSPQPDFAQRFTDVHAPAAMVASGRVADALLTGLDVIKACPSRGFHLHEESRHITIYEQGGHVRFDDTRRLRTVDMREAGGARDADVRAVAGFDRAAYTQGAQSASSHHHQPPQHYPLVPHSQLAALLPASHRPNQAAYAQLQPKSAAAYPAFHTPY
jgi:proteasome lid subunit RPN8/RPN11